MATLRVVYYRSLTRNCFRVPSFRKSCGNAAYWVEAFHQKLVFATERCADVTTLVPAVLVGYRCCTPLARALVTTACKYSGVRCNRSLCTAAKVCKNTICLTLSNPHGFSSSAMEVSRRPRTSHFLLFTILRAAVIFLWRLLTIELLPLKMLALKPRS